VRVATAGSLVGMSEQAVEAWDDEGEFVPEPPTRPDPTGVQRVDAVLEAVADLDELPVAERVAAFETAHAELRGTLDDPSADSA